MYKTTLPQLPYDQWKETKITLHLFTQIVGKVRMSLVPRHNHWWHVPLYVTPRGLTTSFMPYNNGCLEMLFDFKHHQLVTRTNQGETSRIPLQNISVAEMYARVLAGLNKLGVKVQIKDEVFDPTKVGSDIPYSKDDRDVYDSEYVERFFAILLRVNSAFMEFRGRYLGKCSPVHMFWHSFDLAVTRFSGRRADISPDADSVTKDAYSHEVSSVGFWPGDNNMPMAAFYNYTAPEPAGIETHILQPSAAWWEKLESSHMALYKYDDFRKSKRPRHDLLSFCQSSYEAGAESGNWPRGDLERVSLK